MPTSFGQDPLISPLASMLGVSGIFLTALSLVVLVWILYWKALALWEASRHRQHIWFLVLLVVHTIGVLEIVYLIWFRKENTEGKVSLFPLPGFLKEIRKVFGSK